ncbi:Putative carbohydrate kinase PfkB, ribokinase [Septoria linicola]|uniref:Carbohydrate kinase PfkB, ribokinase n=1 Tax=Septoria linicola TaxID=215465 RepID=A0A9Q9AWB4_9PEZI|nr:putative carbohydrate kinase PfkB, ribokinase [Septoria linicola]USW56330.1 Putative carbohydrate kinase PfkB, ribokinase [Septoria linicola]
MNDDQIRARAMAADFVALGGVWLDEIRKAGNTLRTNVVGGSVTYATLGARLFSSTRPEMIRLVLFEGTEFPQEVLDTFRHWRVGLTILPCGNAPAARGIVHYGNTENERFYERLTSPLDTSTSDLDRIDILEARCFHFFDIPATVLESVQTISQARQDAHRSSLSRKARLVMWEPQAKSCKPEYLAAHLLAAYSVDVFSPNHMELASFFDKQQSGVFDRNRVVQQANTFIESGIGSGFGCAIVRCAEHGCLVMLSDDRTLTPSRTVPPTWLPAYYGTESNMVVNSTGAGNAFLGSYAIGYQETGSYVEAAKFGTVGASFMVEQHGTPDLTGEGVEELWNGASVRRRLEEYTKRCAIA